MARGSIRAGHGRRSRLTTAALPLLILLFAATTVAATRVYRCTYLSGDLEFRQTPCAGGTEERKVWIKDHRTG